MIALASASYLVVLLFGSIFVALDNRDDSQHRIVVLGSGNRLSLLIASGSARMLIASGNDGSALMNALDSARSITDRRIDIAVIAGSSDDVAVSQRVIADLSPRRLFLLGEAATAEALFESGQTVITIVEPMRFDLSGDVSVLIEPHLGASSDEWIATVQRNQTRVVALSRADILLNHHDVHTTVIFVSDVDLSEPPVPSGGAIVVREGTISVGKLQAELPANTFDQLWLVSTAIGRSSTIQLNVDGVVLPGDAISVVPPTMNSQGFVTPPGPSQPLGMLTFARILA